MNEQPIPPSIWLRIVAFLAPGRYGRIEIDVKNGRVAGCRIVESLQPEEHERPLVALREAS